MIKILDKENVSKEFFDAEGNFDANRILMLQTSYTAPERQCLEENYRAYLDNGSVINILKDKRAGKGDIASISNFVSVLGKYDHRYVNTNRITSLGDKRVEVLTRVSRNVTRTDKAREILVNFDNDTSFGVGHIVERRDNTPVLRLLDFLSKYHLTISQTTTKFLKAKGKANEQIAELMQMLAQQTDNTTNM